MTTTSETFYQIERLGEIIKSLKTENRALKRQIEILEGTISKSEIGILGALEPPGELDRQIILATCIEGCKLILANDAHPYNSFAAETLNRLKAELTNIPVKRIV